MRDTKLKVGVEDCKIEMRDADALLESIDVSLKLAAVGCWTAGGWVLGDFNLQSSIFNKLFATCNWQLALAHWH
jgi:hypothetical protein